MISWLIVLAKQWSDLYSLRSNSGYIGNEGAVAIAEAMKTMISLQMLT